MKIYYLELVYLNKLIFITYLIKLSNGVLSLMFSRYFIIYYLLWGGGETKGDCWEQLFRGCYNELYLVKISGMWIHLGTIKHNTCLQATSALTALVTLLN